MNAAQLKASILQLAVQGRLVEQDPNDEPASVLLDRIRAKKERLISEGKVKREKTPSRIYRGDDGHFYEQIGTAAPVCIDDELPFEIPESWEWVRLGNIGETCIGLTYSPSDIAVRGIPILRSNNIQAQKPDYTELVFVNCNVPERAMIHQGDILICVRNGSRALVGKSAIVDKDGYAFGAFMAKFTSSYNLYIHIFFSSPSFRQQLTDVNTETINQITQNKLKSLLIPFPPLAEQHHIVAKIDKLMPLVADFDKVERELSVLEKDFPDALKKSILQDAVQGRLVEQDPNDEPASALLARIRAEKDRLIAEGKIKKEKTQSRIYRGGDGHFYEQIGDAAPVCIDDELPFEIPETWEWVRPSDIGYFSSGHTPKPNELSINGKYPYFKVADMNTNGNEIYLSLTQSFLPAEYSKKLFDANTIVFPKNGGAVMTNKKRILSQTSLVDLNTGTYAPYQTIDVMFVYYLFQTVDFKKYFKGTALPTVDYEAINNLLWGLPPLAEQRRIVAKIDELMEMVEEMRG